MEGTRILEHIQAEHSSRYDLSQLQFRRIYEELSGERILVSEFVEGQTLDALIRAGQLSYASLLQLFRLHGYFLFAVGIFHGDIHPGNIILRDNSFVFLDTGYIGRATTKMRRNLFYFFAALCQDDYAAAATSLNAMAEQPIEGARYAAFQRKFLELYREFPGKTVGEVSLTQKMMQTIRLGVDSGMHFDEGMFDIIRSLMFLDGMVLRVNPQAVLLRDMREFVESFAVYVG